MTSVAGAVAYAQYVSSIEAPPPYHFPDVIVHAFVIDVAMGPVQQYADRMFNLGPQKTRGFAYRTVPTWPYGLLLFIQYPKMICTQLTDMGSAPGYGRRGIITQTEAFLAIPLIRYGTTWKAPLETTVDWMLPFITVENPMSAACGREVLGLEKLLADIEIGEWKYPESFEAKIKIPGWKTHSEHEVQDEGLTFAEVKTHPPMPTPWPGGNPLGSPLGLLQSRAGTTLVDSLADLSLWAGRLSLGTLPLDMRTVSLKQFRDAANPAQAIYQALVTCRSRYTDVRDFRVFNENGVSVVFNNFASFNPILQLFMNGIDLTIPQIQVPCRAAYSLRATIDYDDLRTIYTAPLEGGQIAPVPPGSDLVAAWARPWVGLFKGTRP
jgi:hypothetical protein